MKHRPARLRDSGRPQIHTLQFSQHPCAALFNGTLIGHHYKPGDNFPFAAFAADAFSADVTAKSSCCWERRTDMAEDRTCRVFQKRGWSRLFARICGVTESARSSRFGKRPGRGRVRLPIPTTTPTGRCPPKSPANTCCYSFAKCGRTTASSCRTVPTRLFPKRSGDFCLRR